MITKLQKDHIIKHAPFCGELRLILLETEYSPDIAIAKNIKTTTAHYHREFDEIYFVLDGTLVLKFYNRKTKKYSTQKLMRNELCVITKGIHHKVIEASKRNRLCVISVPNFNEADEHRSKKL